MVQYSIRLTFVYMFIRQKTDINFIHLFHCDSLSFSAQIQIYYWNIVIQLTLDSARARTLQLNPNYAGFSGCANPSKPNPAARITPAKHNRKVVTRQD